MLLTVTLCGFDGHANWPECFEPPSLRSVPISAPVDVMYTRSVADALVLVASIRSSRFCAVYSARVTLTRSAPADAGWIVSYAVFVTTS